MKRALVIWFFVAALVAMGCSPPPDSFGSVGTLQDSWVEIWDWYDLDAIRNDLSGSYMLMTDLDSTTAGYGELAGPTANDGKGWRPIGTWGAPFNGSYDGQGLETRDLFVNRPSEDYVGLFGCVRGGLVENVRLVNAAVSGRHRVGCVVGYAVGASVANSGSTGVVDGVDRVGGLVGDSHQSTLTSSCSTALVTGSRYVGGLLGYNEAYAGVDAVVDGSCAAGSVTGDVYVGGLVGQNYGTVTDSNPSGTVNGGQFAAGLVGINGGSIGFERARIRNSYSTATVTGIQAVGGLTGISWGGTISNSYYNCSEALINGQNTITAGALFSEDFEEWLTNEKFIDVNERLSQEDGYYMIDTLSDFKELLAFGQDSSLKFRLRSDLDLGVEPSFFIPYLSGEFDGNGHKISSLSFNNDLVANVGLFGYLASTASVVRLGVEHASLTGNWGTGGIAGFNWGGAVVDSYATGNVTGFNLVGGLVGWNMRYGSTVTDCHFIGTVTGYQQVGGLVGLN